MTQKAVLGLAGDVLVDRDNPPEVFELVQPILDATDLLFANLEGPYTDHPVPAVSAPVLVTPGAKNLDVYAQCGFDVLAMANNHIVDAGHAAMLETQQRLREQGKVRFLSLSSHNRPLLPKLFDAYQQGQSPYDLFMLRYNAVHRGAENDVFPFVPEQRGPGIVASHPPPSPAPPVPHRPPPRGCFRPSCLRSQLRTKYCPENHSQGNHPRALGLRLPLLRGVREGLWRPVPTSSSFQKRLAGKGVVQFHLKPCPSAQWKNMD